MSDKEDPQFSALKADAEFVECALNSPVLIPGILSTFFTHLETVEGRSLSSLKLK